MVARRLLLAAAFAGLVHLAAHADGPPTRLRGMVDSLSDNALSITLKSGEKALVAMTDKTGVAQVLPYKLSDIRKGQYIGTAAVPGMGGKLMALEVLVFPEAMRGTGDGHYPWDLQPESSMTNGAIGDVSDTGGKTLTVKYKGGQQTVQVPDGTPVVTVGPGTRAMLTPGAHVIAFASKGSEGEYTALRVLVGKDGMTPPM